MKTTTLLSILMITLSSFELRESEISATHKLGMQVVNTLQHPSPDDVSALFPSLDEFFLLMDENENLYGENLEAAKRELGQKYHAELLPSFKKAFEAVISQGEEAGIDWSNIRFETAEAGIQPESKFAVAPLTIVFSAQGKPHRLHVEKALIFNGQWRISQFISLE